MQGEAASGNLITLPPGYRPAALVIAVVGFDDNGVAVASLYIDNDGTVPVNSLPTTAGNGNQSLDLYITFRAAGVNTIKIPTPLVA